MPKRKRSPGFTFIEVLIAMAIFTLAVLAAVDISGGSVRAARDAREMSVATWLLQQKMVELETKLETDGFEKGCEEKSEGKFEAPHENYTWTSSCEEVDFQISETAAALAKAQAEGDEDESASTSENQILKLILKTASDYITQSLRELHVEVSWKSGKYDKSVDATTHFVRYDQKVSLGFGGATTGGDNANEDGGANPGGTTQ